MLVPRIGFAYLPSLFRDRRIVRFVQHPQKFCFQLPGFIQSVNNAVEQSTLQQLRGANFPVDQHWQSRGQSFQHHIAESFLDRHQGNQIGSSVIIFNLVLPAGKNNPAGSQSISPCSVAFHSRIRADNQEIATGQFFRSPKRDQTIQAFAAKTAANEQYHRRFERNLPALAHRLAILMPLRMKATRVNPVVKDRDLIWSDGIISQDISFDSRRDRDNFFHPSRFKLALLDRQNTSVINTHCLPKTAQRPAFVTHSAQKTSVRTTAAANHIGSEESAKAHYRIVAPVLDPFLRRESRAP